MKIITKILILLFASFQILLFSNCEKDDTENIPEELIDAHGNIYSTVKIGNQTWMSENLRYFSGGETSAYDNDNINMMPTYGFLYNWESANEACPDGWHLPAVEDWNILINYLGGEEIAGGKLKESGTLHWNSPNDGATNESGFTSLPGGMYNSTTNNFQLVGLNAIYWTSTSIDSLTASLITMNYMNTGTIVSLKEKESKLSIRCLKD